MLVTNEYAAATDHRREEEPAMDLIRINDNKLKIMLTPSDMECYALDADTMDYTQTETRRAFRSILDEARNRTGFDVSGDKIYIQFYPSRGGGCEMFVTKYDLVCAVSNPADRPPATVQGRATLKQQTRDDTRCETERNRSAAYVFESMEHLLCACRHLLHHAFSGSSAAYRGEEGRYYLLLSEHPGLKRNMIGDRATAAFLHEYGTEQDAELVRLYIKEHAHPICERHAVRRLGEL